jgi:glutamate/tyrosine decarboxylase-like PLP-dependent enzyme
MATSKYCSRKQEDLLQLLTEVSKLAAEYISQHYDREHTKVIDFHTPEELKKLFDFTLPKEGVGLSSDLSSVRDTIKDILKFSVRTGSPRYFNQLWSGTDLANIVAEYITAFTNASTYTYEVAPVYSIMEIELVNHLNKIVGWSGGDGILTPGGSVSNLMALLCARARLFPYTKLEGMRDSDKLVAFTSVHSHYTIKRAAFMMGIGMNNVVNVPVGPDGKMDTQLLEAAVRKAIADGKKPFFVNSTAGSTVLGIFDPIPAIADICEKYNMWLHVDGALGGAVLLSQDKRRLLKGVERADSLCFCLHKMLGFNQQCSVFLSKHENVLKNTNASNADYLFHDHDETPYDLGDKTLLCGRRQDSLKAWLSWKVHGDKGFEERIDHNFANAQYCAQRLRERKDKFELLAEPECIQVCFFFVPKSVRGLPKGPERDRKLGLLTPMIRREIQKSGRMLVNYNPLHASEPNFAFLPNHFRIVFSNPEQTREDVDFALDEIERLGENLSVE